MKTPEARALIGQPAKFVYANGRTVYATIQEVRARNAYVRMDGGATDWLYLPDIVAFHTRQNDDAADDLERAQFDADQISDYDE